MCFVQVAATVKPNYLTFTAFTSHNTFFFFQVCRDEVKTHKNLTGWTWTSTPWSVSLDFHTGRLLDSGIVYYLRTTPLEFGTLRRGLPVFVWKKGNQNKGCRQLLSLHFGCTWVEWKINKGRLAAEKKVKWEGSDWLWVEWWSVTAFWRPLPPS